MTHVFNRKHIYIVVWGFVFFCLPIFIYAAIDEFVPLVGFPGLEDAGGPNMQTYIDALIRISIIAASLIAVVKLVLAGSKYVLSGIVTDKEGAKKDIKAALIGLLIILSAVTILKAINPDLLNLPTLTPLNITQSETSYAIPDEVVEMCAKETGGCAKISCEYFNSYKNLHWTVGWLPTVTGTDYLLNTVQCAARCAWSGGDMVGTSNCVYPTNPEAVAAAAEAQRQELLKQGVELKVVAFTTAPEEDLKRLQIDYGVQKEDVIGQYSLSASEEIDLITGKEDVGIYQDVINKIISETCTQVGGSSVITIPANAGGRKYYCRKK